MQILITTILAAAASVLAMAPPETAPNPDPITPDPFPVPEDAPPGGYDRFACRNCLEHCQDVEDVQGKDQSYTCIKYLCIPKCFTTEDDGSPVLPNCTVPFPVPQPTLECNCPVFKPPPPPLKCPKPQWPKGCPRCPAPCVATNNTFIQFADDE